MGISGEFIIGRNFKNVWASSKAEFFSGYLFATA